ncbi:hypothetical protein R1sor_024600 [Riccia sorocarpa]|uniref:Uncharacterized protein n=1 Tax=Riccia sorocarpa TaxID=122646 RepID=A0ABD3GTE6_9MARC
MSEGAWMDSEPAEIGWLDLEDLTDTGMQTSSMDPVRSTEPTSGSQPATIEPKKKKKKKKKAIPDVQAAVLEGVDVPSPDEISLIPPNGIPGEVCLGIRVNVDEFKNDSTSGPGSENACRGSNQPLTSDVPVDDHTAGSNTLPSIRVLEESASNLATYTMSHITLVMEERKRVQRLQASLEERLAKIQKENLAFKNKVHTLEDEKQQMSDRVALMGKLELYELLGAKMEGFQLPSHVGTVVEFQNLVLTTT